MQLSVLITELEEFVFICPNAKVGILHGKQSQQLWQQEPRCGCSSFMETYLASRDSSYHAQVTWPQTEAPGYSCTSTLLKGGWTLLKAPCQGWWEFPGAKVLLVRHPQIYLLMQWLGNWFPLFRAALSSGCPLGPHGELWKVPESTQTNYSRMSPEEARASASETPRYSYTICCPDWGPLI